MDSVRKVENSSDGEETSANSVPCTVKSKAIVKYSQIQMPVSFNQLAFNTNLNMPTGNCLMPNDNSEKYENDHVYGASGFDSFRMTHMFPDCVGEVDVISDAENIKKLLKLPYAMKTAISMTVHKIGNTLLLDEFDIHKYLLRRQNDDWKWLRRFILEDIIAYHGGIQKFSLVDKSLDTIHTNNLLSKFLHYSQKSSVICGMLPTASNSENTTTKKENNVSTNDKNISPIISANTGSCTTVSDVISNNSGNNNSTGEQNDVDLPIKTPVLPEPKIEENIPDPTSTHAFQRNVVWTFEDIRMLIGTDMPIFGGPNRPCISLRLNDMAKPINVLTGIDYWLDNLMCNVPEVVMCYHLDGIVQKYEIVKTEDLPKMQNSEFSPELVRNVAQNILSFLKSKATKEGHTYWLFKGHNDEVAKLYDLTTLCRDSRENSFMNKSVAINCNPFTVSVGMLLYTVARNMKIRFNRSKSLTTKDAGYIRALLNNTTKLLPKEKYSQILASSHYLLSDLYVPVGTDPTSPKFQKNPKNSKQHAAYEYEDDDDDDEKFYNNSDCFNVNGNGKEIDNDSKDSISVKNICDTLKTCNISNAKSSKFNNRPPPLIVGTEERCNMALEEINKGFLSLEYFSDNEQKFIKNTEVYAKKEEMKRILEEERKADNAKKVRKKSKQPTKQSKLNNSNDNSHNNPNGNNGKESLKKNSNCDKIDEPLTMLGQLYNRNQIINNFNTHHFGSWKIHLKLLLIEKACLTYTILAEVYYNAHKFGSCLKAIYLSYHCQEVLVKYMEHMVSKKSCLLSRAGDYFYLIAKHWSHIDVFIKQFHEQSEIEKSIIRELNKDLDIAEEAPCLVPPPKNFEQLMIISCRFYERAINMVEQSEKPEEKREHMELLRRLGNVNNELGLKYMFWAQEKYFKLAQHPFLYENAEENAEEPIYFKLAVKSYDCLKSGIHCFTLASDVINSAYLNCNLGRFMRFRAYIDVLELDISKADLLKKQKCFYYEAFELYEKGLHLLGNRKFNEELWDLISWELSTAIFALAQQLQDDFLTRKEIRNDELEKELLQLLQRALKACDVHNNTEKRLLYMFRSGRIYKRIAQLHLSLLHSQLSYNGVLLKTTLQLCKYNFHKAAEVFGQLNETNEVFLAMLQHLELEEFLADHSNQINNKIKHFQTALELCLNMKYPLKNINCTSLANAESKSQKNMLIVTDNLPERNLITTMKFFHTRLQFVLRTLIKLFTNIKDPKKHILLYKDMYLETLNTSKELGSSEEDVHNAEDLSKRYYDLLQKLHQLDYKWECVDKFQKQSVQKTK